MTDIEALCQELADVPTDDLVSVIARRHRNTIVVVDGVPGCDDELVHVNVACSDHPEAMRLLGIALVRISENELDDEEVE